MTLQEIKKYCAIDADYTDDDDMLLSMYNSVDDAARAYCCIDASVSDLPLRVQQAELMMIAELYANREMQTANSLKQSPVFQFLLSTAINYQNTSF